MKPALKEGDIVLAVKWPIYKVGDIVIAKANDIEVVKRITEVLEGKYKIVGDNRMQSTDSRNWGLLSKSSLKGKVIYKRKLN